MFYWALGNYCLAFFLTFYGLKDLSINHDPDESIIKETVD